jgi:hypothetical protein
MMLDESVHFVWFTPPSVADRLTNVGSNER